MGRRERRLRRLRRRENRIQRRIERRERHGKDTSKLERRVNKIEVKIANNDAHFNKIDNHRKAMAMNLKKGFSVGKTIATTARRGVKWIKNHKKLMHDIVNTTAVIAEAGATAIGQPELVAGIEAAKQGANKAIDFVEKADNAIDTAEKVVHITQSLTHKGDAISKLKAVLEALKLANSQLNNPQLGQIISKIEESMELLEAGVGHIEDVVELIKEGAKLSKDPSIKGIIDLIGKSVKKGKDIKHDVEKGKVHFQQLKNN